MYRKINIVTLTFAAAMLISSCEDWLDLKPENYIIKQEFWQTKQQVHSAVIGCYASLLDEPIAKRLFLWTELRGDLLTNNVGINFDNSMIMYGYIMPYNSLLKWESLYKSINICNTVIDYAKNALTTDNTFTESELKAYEAEALTLRSLLYFYLVRSFGEVPLMLDAITSDEANFFVPKSADSVIINQIIYDLGIAEQSAVASYDKADHNKGRITKYAVNALQADVYLWNEDYSNCIEACNKIINSNKYGLVSGDLWFQNIFVTGNSNESIFELQFNPGKPNPFYDFFHPTSGEKQFLASQVVTELYEDGDVRGDSATFWQGEEADPAIYKYLGLSNTERQFRTSSGSYAHWIFYRYADILLMKAEALNQMEEGSEAIELIHRIQSRAKTSLTQADVDDYDAITDLILLERQKELAYEGKRWYDVLRNAKRDNYRRKDILFNMIDNYASADQADLLYSKYSDNRSHYFPIYYREIELNPQLEQNPYYGD
jgi:hypothetical protein